MIILKGEGRAFCAGMDLKVMENLLEMGLVYKVVPRERLDEEVEELATKILKQSRFSLAITKSQINKCVKVNWLTALERDDLIRKGLIANFITPEGESRLRTFIERRA